MNPRALYTEITLPRRIRPSQHTDIHGLRSAAVHFNLYFHLAARHGVPRTVQNATSAPTKAIYQTILQVSQRSGSSPSLDPSTTRFRKGQKRVTGTPRTAAGSRRLSCREYVGIAGPFCYHCKCPSADNVSVDELFIRRCCSSGM